ncbi:hypothetical protein PG994_002465 [Apiospora phragmitis]|uniref:Uncharacterized protein n=1 Tax=Apiospora phragmitis TaxID=2905665 RepID=A0ABR1WWF7_9PEZI
MAPRIIIPKLSEHASSITTPRPSSPDTKRRFRHALPPSPLAASPQCPPPPLRVRLQRLGGLGRLAPRTRAADREHARGDEEAELEECERKFVKKTHDCVMHCDFPSQCFHTQVRVMEDRMPEAAKVIEAAEKEEAEATAKAEEDEWQSAYEAYTSQARQDDADDDRLELNLARELAGGRGRGFTHESLQQGTILLRRPRVPDDWQWQWH